MTAKRTFKGHVTKSGTVLKHPVSRAQRSVREFRRAQAARYAAQSVKMTGDEAIALYRAEKAKRATQKEPMIAAARKAYEQQQQAAKDARKGGRPKGGKGIAVGPKRRGPTIHVQSRDPADALVDILPEWRAS